MKKFIITALCISIAFFSFAKGSATNKKNKDTNITYTLNATVTTTGSSLIITALSEYPKAVDVMLTDDYGNELYQGKLVKGDLTQNAILNLEQLGEGTYNVVLSNGKDKVEKKVTVNTNTTKELLVK